MLKYKLQVRCPLGYHMHLWPSVVSTEVAELVQRGMVHPSLS